METEPCTECRDFLKDQSMDKVHKKKTVSQLQSCFVLFCSLFSKYEDLVMAGLGLALHGLIPSHLVWHGPVWCFMHKFNIFEL
jgi:hypothetical protein